MGEPELGPGGAAELRPGLRTGTGGLAGSAGVRCAGDRLMWVPTGGTKKYLLIQYASGLQRLSNDC